MRFGNLGFAGFISLALEVSETSETQTLYETLHGVDSVSTLCTAWYVFLVGFYGFSDSFSTFWKVFFDVFFWISWGLIDIYPRRHDLEGVRASFQQARGFVGPILGCQLQKWRICTRFDKTSGLGAQEYLFLMGHGVAKFVPVSEHHDPSGSKWQRALKSDRFGRFYQNYLVVHPTYIVSGL